MSYTNSMLEPFRDKHHIARFGDHSFAFVANSSSPSAPCRFRRSSGSTEEGVLHCMKPAAILLPSSPVTRSVKPTQCGLCAVETTKLDAAAINNFDAAFAGHRFKARLHPCSSDCFSFITFSISCATGLSKLTFRRLGDNGFTDALAFGLSADALAGTDAVTGSIHHIR